MALPDWLGELESWLVQKAFVKFPIQIQKLVGYPNDATKFLRGDGVWAAAAPTTYRKTTAKAVNTTVAATDLLNGEITVAANAMGSTGMLRLTAIGDMLNNSGGAVAPPRFQLLFGGTTIFDTGALGADFANAAATRRGWRVKVEIFNTASGAQVCFFKLDGALNAAASNGVAFTTGEGNYVVVGGSAATVMLADGYNSASVDTTAAKALVLNVINGSASASYETKLTSALVEII